MILNQSLHFLFPALAKEYQSSLFRPWSDPLMMAYFLHPFILGVALAYFWSLFGKEIKGKVISEKAFSFAKLYFIIATIPGMFISLTSFKVSFLMVASWTLAGFIQVFLAGYIIARSRDFN
jgi:hypothetical protein